MTELDSLNSLIATIIKTGATYHSMTARRKVSVTIEFEGEMYCQSCSGNRRMEVKNIYMSEKLERNALDQLTVRQEVSGAYDPDNFQNKVIKFLAPSLWNYTCLQCKSLYTSVIYNGPNGLGLVVLSNNYGGISTLNTPESVSYYLDQAYKSQAVGAKSASMSMYRSALEQLLFDQGYTVKTLDSKIKELLKSVSEKTAPEWAYRLEEAYLEYIKKLGNGAIHPNDGNIEQQSALDNELLNGVQIFFNMLLTRVYEYKTEQDKLLSLFKDRSGIINKR